MVSDVVFLYNENIVTSVINTSKKYLSIRIEFKGRFNEMDPCTQMKCRKITAVMGNLLFGLISKNERKPRETLVSSAEGLLVLSLRKVSATERTDIQG